MVVWVFGSRSWETVGCFWRVDKGWCSDSFVFIMGWLGWAGVGWYLCGLFEVVLYRVAGGVSDFLGVG